MADNERAETLLEQVKAALRVSHDALDNVEIVPLIEAAKKDLQSAGVIMLEESDPMIARAVVVYCKAHFGFDNPDSERLERVYTSIKHTLSLLEEYTAGGGGNG